MTVFKTDNSGLTVAERKQVQEALLRHGYDLGPAGADGIFGNRTNAAITAFKRSIGYKPTPFVGPLTWDQLMKSKPETALTREELPWIKEAIRVIRLHEVHDNKKLSVWLKSDGSTLGDPAQLPWCGDFVHTALRLGLPSERYPGPLGQNPYWALNWRHLGVGLMRPAYGAVASISRNGGGHVGFVVGEDLQNIYLLGGNQNNRVSIAPFSKARFVPESYRWPLTWERPADFTLPKLTPTTAANPSMT
jgi:uncharacterized protein (TIGR02594 family)